MDRQFAIGIIAAVLAAFFWSLNFIAPYAMGPYTSYDLAVCRFLISGGLGFIVLKLSTPRGACRTELRDWLVAAGLGFLGYVGYFVTIMGAVVYAGPIIPPAFVALVPVVLAIAGNWGQGRIPWRSLLIPLACALSGLLLLNVLSMNGLAQDSVHDMLTGICLSFAAVVLWTVFGVANQAALRQRPHMSAWRWTALMMIGGGLEIAAFIPVGLAFDLFQFPRIDVEWQYMAPFLLLGTVLAVCGSLGGSWAWTIASKNLPMGLAGQLIATETVFATLFGLIAHHRWPTWFEAAGITLLLAGVITAIRAFHQQRQTGLTQEQPSNPG